MTSRRPSPAHPSREDASPAKGSELPKVRLKSVQMQIREQLAHDIISGALSPGARITQAQLASQFGVSLAPVREALRELNNEGLVELDPFTGVTVHRPTLQSLKNVYEVRLALEPIAILAEPLELSDEAVARASDLIAVMEKSVEKSNWTAANREFHRLLRSSCPNELALQLLQRLENLFDLYVSISIIDRADANEEHRQMLDAYLGGTSSQILKLTEDHITRTFDACTRLLAEPAGSLDEKRPARDRNENASNRNAKRRDRATVR